MFDSEFSARISGRSRRSRPKPARQHLLFWAVSEAWVRRGLTHGRLEPYLLDGQDVIWRLRGLLLRRLVIFHRLGPPTLTARGWTLLADLSGPVSPPPSVARPLVAVRNTRQSAFDQ
jgi:hypothetical protein